MSVQIGPNSDKPVQDGLGCLFMCIGATILLWALSGFPAIPR